MRSRRADSASQVRGARRLDAALEAILDLKKPIFEEKKDKLGDKFGGELAPIEPPPEFVMPPITLPSP
ncbi:MAG: hypothetical protein ACKV2T_35155 [Kofleriaceae bacterium]